MKKIFLLIVIILLTGCSVKYKINIKSDSIEENIDFVLEKKGITDGDMVESSIGSDEYIDSIINSKLPAIGDNNDYTYQKEVKQDGNKYNVHLNYKYNANEYTKSNIINECFENHEIKIDGENVYIHLTGEFTCYNGETIDIEIKSDNSVKNHNGKKKGSSYNWQINDDNYSNVDILIETSSVSNVRRYIYYAIAIIAGIAVVIFVIYHVGIFLGKDDVNSI